MTNGNDGFIVTLDDLSELMDKVLAGDTEGATHAYQHLTASSTPCHVATMKRLDGLMTFMGELGQYVDEGTSS